MNGIHAMGNKNGICCTVLQTLETKIFRCKHTPTHYEKYYIYRYLIFLVLFLILNHQCMVVNHLKHAHEYIYI